MTEQAPKDVLYDALNGIADKVYETVFSGDAGPLSDHLLDVSSILLQAGARGFDENDIRDGGRSAMLQSLRGALAFLKSQVPIDSWHLLKPLDALADALDDLDRGIVPPALKVQRSGNRDSGIVVELKAGTLVLADILKERSGRSQKDADRHAKRMVARAARAAGVEAVFKQGNVESWRRGARRSAELRESMGLARRWLEHMVRAHNNDVGAALRTFLENAFARFADRAQREPDES